MPKEKVAQSKEGLPPKKRKRRNGQANGANQWIANPQQFLFLQYYILDKKSGTYGNAIQSAIKAGYSPEYARNLTTEYPEWLQDWVRENITDDELVRIGEKNLRDDMTMDVTQPVITSKGLLRDEKGELIRIRDPRLMKLKADQSKFGMQALNPKKYADTKKLAGADGEQLAVRILVD